MMSFMFNFDVVTGQLAANSCGKTRNEADFANHIRRRVGAEPAATQWQNHSSGLTRVKPWLYNCRAIYAQDH